MHGIGKHYSLKLISKYRTVLMGISILMITFCHLDVARRHNGLPGIRLGSFLHLFTVGVDIFMFLSGYGLWHSLNRNSNVKKFLKKRINKLIPKYLIIGGITYCLYDLIIARLGILKFIQDYTFLSWVLYGNTRYWFVAGILLFYLCFPLIFKMVSDNSQNNQFKMIVFMMIFYAVIVFLDSHFARYRDFRIAIERLPVFIFGAFCAKHSDHNVGILPLCLIIITGILFTAMQLVLDGFQSWVSRTTYMYYLSRGLCALSLMAIIILCAEKYNNKPAKYLGLFGYIGGITYEIYLFHQSYLILFEFPPNLPGYLLAAVILPILSGIVSQYIYIYISK